MRCPRPLRDARLLKTIEDLDAQFGREKLSGSFSIEFHYGRAGEPKEAKVVGLNLSFDAKADPGILTLE